jgi:hypothetical protein
MKILGSVSALEFLPGKGELRTHKTATEFIVPVTLAFV